MRELEGINKFTLDIDSFQKRKVENMKEVVHEMISAEDVQKKIEEMAAKISEDYAGKTLHLICVLKGSVFFCCELAKYLTVPVTMDFMTASSYGDATKSSGILKIKKDLDESIEGLDCMVIEDIIDSGNTLKLIKDMLISRNPASLTLCTLLDKPDRREVEVDMDYTGFAIPDEFVIGYGLDYAQKYRNLPFVGTMEFVED